MHMGHVALRVADIDAYIDHITAALGLIVLDRGPEAAYLATQDVRHELQLIGDDEDAFAHVGLMVDTPEEVEATVERALAAGGRRVELPDEPGCEAAQGVVGPAGVVHQIYVPARRPPQRLDYLLQDGLRRFGHITLLSDEADAIVRFWVDGLGCRLSDAATGFQWVRCDAWHHSLAVGPHPETTVLHHHAWEIQDVAALAKHCDVNALAGRPQKWGPVRHGPGFNLAAYMPDATGTMIEVYSDLLVIEDDDNYVPYDWSDEPLALNLWGTLPPPDALAAGIPVRAADQVGA